MMIDEGRCVGCNACGRYCPTDATWYDKVQKGLYLTMTGVSAAVSALSNVSWMCAGWSRMRAMCT